MSFGTGKYSFPGIQKAGAAAIKAALASSGWGAGLLASPFMPVITYVEEWLIEWLTNKGLVVINVGVFYVDGKLDQKGFDQAIDNALSRVKTENLTDAQKKSLDDQVIKAFRKFGKLNSFN